jgi:uncharacterized OsmC-like protein
LNVLSPNVSTRVKFSNRRPCASVEGDLDLRGFLGLAPNVRKGYRGIRLKVRIKADITDEQFKELSSLGPQFSPVFDSIANGVPIAVTTERIA